MDLNPPAQPLPLGPGRPVPGIALAGDPASARSRFGRERPLPDGFVERLAGTGVEVDVSPAARAETSRDWWPIGLVWATEGQVPAMAGAVARPVDGDGVVAVVRECAQVGVPITVVAGRSGVLGASVPLEGGVALDLTAMSGITEVDQASGIVSVLPGTFGDHFEANLRSDFGLTVGHWPQSMALSTVGGWVACRGAGQYSTRYGKIEDLVVGLDVVLADGTLVRTGGSPRAAQGPDLTQLFVGSEGALGVIVGVRLRARPLPEAEGRAAYTFGSFDDALEAMRRTVQRGATPAVLRLYDATEGERGFNTGTDALLLALDEGDPSIVRATLSVLDDEATRTGTAADVALVERWMQRRNNVAELEDLVGKGFVVDTLEISGPWSALGALARDVVAALEGVEGTLVASTHQSHSYLDGGCLYFTFAGGVEPDRRTAYHQEAWAVATRAVLDGGGSLSHHHGVGIGRAPFMADALGEAGLGVLEAVKAAIDPQGLLNPGGLGLGFVPAETDRATSS
ncbi:MAG: FAD-binding oxidoreductase [Microthrixaceae bacterium]